MSPGTRTDSYPASPVGQAGYHQTDTSCPISSDTWTSAYWSAQTAITGADLIAGGERSVYALSRPPGHHAPVLPIVLYNGETRWQAAQNLHDLVEAVPGGLELGSLVDFLNKQMERTEVLLVAEYAAPMRRTSPRSETASPAPLRTNREP